MFTRHAKQTSTRFQTAAAIRIMILKKLKRNRTLKSNIFDSSINRQYIQEQEVRENE